MIVKKAEFHQHGKSRETKWSSKLEYQRELRRHYLMKDNNIDSTREKIELCYQFTKSVADVQNNNI